jgi:GntR family transcriptional regulator
MDKQQQNIDREKGIPAYLQLVNILTHHISNGDYHPGSRLPSESKLCKRYRVSPMTVRRSIKTLIDLGYVSTIQGSGTYVKSPDLNGVSFSLDEFYKIFNDKERIKVNVLKAMIIKADKAAADKLSIKTGDRTIFLKRLLVRDGDPIIFHMEQLIYDPYLPIVEAELEVTSLHGLFVGNGETILKRGDLFAEAVVLNSEEAELLNTILHQPAFRLEHIFYDFDDKPLSWGRFICRGDRFRFTASVGVPSQKPSKDTTA